MFKKLPPKQKLLVLGFVLIVLPTLLLGGSIFNFAHNKWELHRLTKQSAQLDAQYEKLLEEKKLLEAKDPHVMQVLARTRYHMVKPGEIEFRFKHD